MPKKKKDEKEFKDYIVTEQWDWDGFAVNWSELPEEIIDAIPSEFFYDTPYILSDGKIEVETVIYLVERDENVKEENYTSHLLPEKEIRILIEK